MKYLFLICFLSPLLLFAQNEETEKYLTLYEHYRKEKKPDSVIVVCKRLMKLDKEAAKEYHLDYWLARAAFDSKQYELALKQSKKIIPFFYILLRTREGFDQNRRYQDLSFKLAEYYHEYGNFRKEYYHLSRINRRFNSLFCGNSRPSWQRNLYHRMIDCSEKMGKTGRVKRLEQKRDEIK